jgi:hypothetical protein
MISYDLCLAALRERKIVVRLRSAFLRKPPPDSRACDKHANTLHTEPFIPRELGKHMHWPNHMDRLGLDLCIHNKDLRTCVPDCVVNYHKIKASNLFCLAVELVSAYTFSTLSHQ